MIHIGQFSTMPFEEDGFVIPKLRFALRNPLLIGELAQNVAQAATQNSLKEVLRSPIEVSKAEVNLVDGTLVQIDKGHVYCCYTALKFALQEIPSGKYAMVFIDDSQIIQTEGSFSVIVNVIYKQLDREVPLILKKDYDTNVLQKWLLNPKRRVYDICILGAQHRSNGIETDLVVYLYPTDCPVCKKSDADPVIISRTMAMLITSTYHRLNCKCGSVLIPEFPRFDHYIPN